jgi:hypothetical protein
LRERVLRFLVRLSLKYKVYYAWSRVYRTLFEWRWRGQTLPTFADVTGLEKALGRMVWRRDSWRMLWDAISDPRATWGRHLTGLPAGDCDDTSFFSAVSLEKIRKRSIHANIQDVLFLTVSWVDERGKVGGHNVCLFAYGETVQASGEDVSVILWGHVSNHHDGKAQRGFRTIENVVAHVLRGRTCLGWALATTDLRLVKYDDGRSA